MKMKAERKVCKSCTLFLELKDVVVIIIIIDINILSSRNI